jgi:hypothetical protein
MAVHVGEFKVEQLLFRQIVTSIPENLQCSACVEFRDQTVLLPDTRMPHTSAGIKASHQVRLFPLTGA